MAAINIRRTRTVRTGCWSWLWLILKRYWVVNPPTTAALRLMRNISHAKPLVDLHSYFSSLANI